MVVRIGILDHRTVPGWFFIEGRPQMVESKCLDTTWQLFCGCEMRWTTLRRFQPVICVMVLNARYALPNDAKCDDIAFQVDPPGGTCRPSSNESRQ